MIRKPDFNGHRQHAMLLNPSDDYKDDAATKYINEALSKGYLTIYLPINGNDNNNNNPFRLSKIPLSDSINYEENVNRGNLLTFDTRTFYNFALAGDLQPFEELKVLIEEAIEERIASKKRNDEDEEEEIVLVVAEVAAELIRNKKFDESLKVEEWWQKTHSEWLQKGLKVTIICPHSSAMLDNGEFMHYKQAISSLHEIILESGSVFAEQKNTGG